MADISRSELSTLIEEAYSQDLLDSALTTSVALQAFTRVDMGTKTTNLPVLATLPEAGFVSESASQSEGVKPTAQATWGNKQLVAEEIAVIIPVHENVIDDATIDVIAELTRQGGAAIGRKLDAAVIFGDDQPASWTSDCLFDAAETFTVGDAVDGEDLSGSILLAAGAVDEAGWDPSTFIGPRGLRYRLANQRDAQGAPVYQPALGGVTGAMGGQVHGLDAVWASGRIWDRDVCEGIVVDASRVMLGVRQDISVKLLDQATVGSINLAERDMVALRFKARYAYVLGNTTNAEGDAPNSPVAAVVPAAS